MLKIYDSQKNQNAKIINKKITKSIKFTKYSQQNQIKCKPNMKKIRFGIF